MGTSHVAHHYVPKFVLEQWQTPPDEKLSTFRWAHGSLLHKRRKAKAVAKMEHLYSRQRGTANPDVWLEQHFLGPHVDDPAAPVHKKMLADGLTSLSRDEQAHWAKFVIAQMLRVPATMERLRQQGRKTLEEGLDEDPHAYLAERGTEPEPTLRAWFERHLPHEFDDMAIRVFPRLVYSQNLLSRVLKGQWALRDLRQSERDLVIGDRPLFVEGRLGEEHLLVMPIDPKRVWLAFDNPQTGANVQQQKDDNFARTINKAMVIQADRYVYSTGMQHEPVVRKYLRETGVHRGLLRG
jgi:hypothetical protein